MTIAESRAEGVQEGLQQGIQQGIIATARRMLPTLDDAAISTFTGLSLEQVQQVRREAEGDT
jgi:predicted transposase YdaD